MSVTRDGLRSTPRGMRSRDVAVFPEAEVIRQQRRVPTAYCVQLLHHGRAVHITHDALFLPEATACELGALYQRYLDWWVDESKAHRQWFPKRGVVWGPMMRDYVGLLVLREHAPWWIALFRELVAQAENPWERERQRMREPAVMVERFLAGLPPGRGGADAQ